MKAQQPAERIRFLRQFYGLTITGLAQKLGLSQPYLSQVESGTRKISDKLANVIEKVFPDINRDWVLSGEGRPWDKDLRPELRHSKKALAELFERGINSREELGYVVSLIQEAWSNCSTATPQFVFKAAQAIAVLLKEASDYKSISSYLASTLAPGEGAGIPIPKRPDWILDHLGNGGEINHDYLVRCLLALVEDAEFKEFPLKAVTALLSPWGFWVARRGQLSNIREKIGEPFPLDASVLLESPNRLSAQVDSARSKRMVVLEEDGIQFNGFFGKESSAALFWQTGAESAERIVITLDAASMLSLMYLMKRLPEGKSAMAGYWELSLIKETSALRHRNIEIYTSKPRLEALFRLMAVIEKDASLYLCLLHEFIDEYGAV